MYMYSHIKLQLFLNENDDKRLPSKTDVIWSQNLPEAVSEGVQLKKIPGGACSQTPLSRHAICAHTVVIIMFLSTCPR